MLKEGETTQSLLCSPTLEVFWVRRVIPGKLSWNCRLLSNNTRKRDCTVTAVVSYGQGLWVSRDILRKWSWNGQPLVDHSGEKLNGHCCGLKQVELCLKDGLEMTGCMMITLEGETAWSLLWSPMDKVFNSLELYLGDGIEMPGHSAEMLGCRDSTVTVVVSQVRRAALGRWSSSDGLISSDTGGRDSVVTFGVP